MKSIILFICGALAALAAHGAVFAQGKTVGPHPTMTKFLAEIEAGKFDKAARRIASVNGTFTVSRVYIYFTQAELVAHLATCELIEHASRKTSVSVEETTWDCPDGDQYSIVFIHEGEASNPYLHVDSIQTERARKAREEEMRKSFASSKLYSGIIPRREMVQTQTLAAIEERQRLEALENARKRDVVGEAVLAGDLDRLAEVTNEASDVFYITHDRYFDVEIQHVNSFGMPEVIAVFRRAFEELGKPVSVECRLGESKLPRQICEWQLENPKNSMRAEMGFSRKDGTIISIRVYRMTPEEEAELRQQAVELGVIAG